MRVSSNKDFLFILLVIRFGRVLLRTFTVIGIVDIKFLHFCLLHAVATDSVHFHRSVVMTLYSTFFGKTMSENY